MDMAAETLVLCNSLCFLINKFGKIDIRTLKSSILVFFYEVDELCGAKRQLLSDVNSMNVDIDAPHVPDRRDGENKVQSTIFFTSSRFLTKT